MIGRGGDRGQINFDFAIGVSIVVVTIVLAFSFVPGVFGGVTEGRQQSDEVVADRVAANLVEGSLNDPSDPGAVDKDCLQALFTTTSECGHDSQKVAENVGVDDRFVNVRVMEGGDRQCLNSDRDFEDESGGSCPAVTLFGGDNPASAEQVGTSRRAVTVDGTHVTIVVRVW